MWNKRKKTWLIILAVIVLLVVVLSLPPVWSRVSYHSRRLYTTVRYWLKPPSEAVFVPSTFDDEVDATPFDGLPATSNPSATLTSAPASLPSVEPSATLTQSTPEATFTPTLTLAPLPSSALLTGFLCERQFMNNCGPATLSVYLSFYDWGKDQLDAAEVLRPNNEDVNVMPYELVDFVNEYTEQRALWRYGGDLQTLKALVNAGFPVMIEKSFEPFSLRTDGWMGHYNLVVGYDDDSQVLTNQDTYLMSYPPWGGGEIPPDQFDDFVGFDFSYSELDQTWRSFNFVFIVVYPPEREQDVLNALGPLATEEGAARIAYERAMQETTSLTDVRDQFFAWFNAGTSLVALEDYAAAATAFDTAYGIYPDIAQESRPYRILWYESGPYSAYYHTERYQDVIDLASKTLGYMAIPVLEESYYWRALSYDALGDTSRAIADLRASLKYHPGYEPSVELLEQLDGTP